MLSNNKQSQLLFCSVHVQHLLNKSNCTVGGSRTLCLFINFATCFKRLTTLVLKLLQVFHNNSFTRARSNLDFYLLYCGYCTNSWLWYLLFRRKRENTYILHHHSQQWQAKWLTMSRVVSESGYVTVIHHADLLSPVDNCM